MHSNVEPLPTAQEPRSLPRERLEDTVVAAFAAETSEARQFVRRHYGTKLVGELPGGDSPLSIFTAAWLDALERRGLLTEVFFAKLMQDAPATLHADIRALARETCDATLPRHMPLFAAHGSDTPRIPRLHSVTVVATMGFCLSLTCVPT